MCFTLQRVEGSVRAGLPAGKLLLCVSGGADSMALLHACRRAGRECAVVHCDFHLRGVESERDRRFVAWVCRLTGVECVQVHFDVPAYMQAHGVSLEMACRELRYAEFRRLRRELGCSRIVTAHNRDDNDETMLLNLFRGTGVAGLCGMEPDNGEIARPFLGFSRREIEEYLSGIGARFIVDSSNLSVDYRRNFIRRELLPLVATRWPGIRKSLARTRQNLREVRRLCDVSMRDWRAETPAFLSAQIYENAPSRSLLLLDWLAGHGASPSQIDEMCSGLRAGCSWHLKDCMVSMQRDGLHLLPLESAPVEYDLTVRPLTDALMDEIRSQRGDEVLYYSGEETLTFRKPRPGDRMAPFGMKGTKLVSDLLREGGVPVPQRDDFLMAVDSRSRVIWLPGVRRSCHLCVKAGRDKEVKILRVKNHAPGHGNSENKC